MRPLCEGIFFWFGKCCLSFHFHESYPLQWVIWQCSLVTEVIHFPHRPAKVSWSLMRRATSLGKVWSQPSCSINTSMTCGNRTGSILFPEWPLEVLKGLPKGCQLLSLLWWVHNTPTCVWSARVCFRSFFVLPVILEHNCRAASCQFDLLKVAALLFGAVPPPPAPLQGALYCFLGFY